MNCQEAKQKQQHRKSRIRIRTREGISYIDDPGSSPDLVRVRRMRARKARCMMGYGSSMADLVLQPYHPALLQEPVPNAPNADSSSTNAPSTLPPASHRRDVSSTTVPPSTPFSQDSNTMLVDGALPPETMSDINKRVALLTGATYHAIRAFFALRNNLGVGGERGEGGNGPGAPPNSRVRMGR